MPPIEASKTTFGKQLADHPTATGAERQTDCHFALPRGRARQEKIGHIGAGNEQDAASGNEKQQRNILRVVFSFPGPPIPCDFAFSAETRTSERSLFTSG